MIERIVPHLGTAQRTLAAAVEKAVQGDGTPDSAYHEFLKLDQGARDFLAYSAFVQIVQARSSG